MEGGEAGYHASEAEVRHAESLPRPHSHAGPRVSRRGARRTVPSSPDRGGRAPWRERPQEGPPRRPAGDRRDGHRAQRRHGPDPRQRRLRLPLDRDGARPDHAREPARHSPRHAGSEGRPHHAGAGERGVARQARAGRGEPRRHLPVLEHAGAGRAGGRVVPVPPARRPGLRPRPRHVPLRHGRPGVREVRQRERGRGRHHRDARRPWRTSRRSPRCPASPSSSWG